MATPGAGDSPLWPPECASNTSYGTIAHSAPRFTASSKKAALDHFYVPSAKTLTSVCALVCGMQLSVQLASETVDGTQVFFIGNLDMDTTLNDGMKFARDRVFMIFTLLCAQCGDTGVGRFETVMIGASVYIAGTLMVSLATHPWISRLVWYLLGAFFVLPFGQAALAANLIIFGADQFNLAYKSHQRLQDNFFHFFNVATYMGTFLAYALLASYGISEGTSHYLTNDDWITPLGLVSDEAYYTVFFVSAGAFVGATVMFAYGKGSFSTKSMTWLPASPIVAVTKLLVQLSFQWSLEGSLMLAAKLVGVTVYVSQALLFWCPELSAPLSTCSAVGVVFSVGGIILFCQNLDWLDDSIGQPNSSISVADIKEFLKLLPIIVCAQTSYGTLYMMMRTWYVRQACQMDLRFDLFGRFTEDSPQIFTVFFDIVNALVVIVGTPLTVFYINPWLASKLRRVGISLDDWTRFLLGFCFGLASCVCAAHYEVSRRASPILDLTSNCAPHGVGVRGMSAYWMLVPYALMGVSTLYVVPAIMSIAYREVPKTVRSICTITNIFMMSASQSVVTAISLGMQEYAPHDLDTGNLEYLYLVCVLISLSMLFIFLFIGRKFKSNTYDDTEILVDDTVSNSGNSAAAS